MGHAERVTCDKDCGKRNTYYMPHHGVVYRNGVTAKLQGIFDASSHIPSLPSFTSVLLKGPKLHAAEPCPLTPVHFWLAKATRACCRNSAFQNHCRLSASRADEHVTSDALKPSLNTLGIDGNGSTSCCFDPRTWQQRSQHPSSDWGTWCLYKNSPLVVSQLGCLLQLFPGLDLCDHVPSTCHRDGACNVWYSGSVIVKQAHDQRRHCWSMLNNKEKEARLATSKVGGSSLYEQLGQSVGFASRSRSPGPLVLLLHLILHHVGMYYDRKKFFQDTGCCDKLDRCIETGWSKQACA